MRSPTLSLGLNAIWLSVFFDGISIMEHKVEELGLILNGYLGSVIYPSSIIIVLIALFKLSNSDDPGGLVIWVKSSSLIDTMKKKY